MIRCSPEVLARIADHARRDAPHECCGLLIGTADRIEEACPVQNHAADPSRRYEIDPRDFLTAVKRCRGTAHNVIGAYHSHPHSQSEPSPTDNAEAFPGFLYVIAGPVAAGQAPQICAYRWDDGNFWRIRLVPDAQEHER